MDDVDVQSASARKAPPMAAGPGFAGYLKLRRTRAIVACFLAASALLAAFSSVDIGLSNLYFDHGFYLANQGWVKLLHQAVRGFIVVSMMSVLGIYAFNRIRARNLFDLDGRRVAYLFLVLVLGAGLIVNVALKDHFGRARPRDIAEFGGSLQFTPAFATSGACTDNCSFSSGDAAGAFFGLPFILLARRKRMVSIAAVGFGVLVSASRIASGAHFLSDTVMSFFVMLIVADYLHYRMFQLQPETEPLVAAIAPESGIRAGATG